MNGFRPGKQVSDSALLKAPTEQLISDAGRRTRHARCGVVTFSRKVFIPLTRLCRDVCHYCTYAVTPKSLSTPYLSVNDAIKIAQAGAAAGCKEALFTLGERPELRYKFARDALNLMGYSSTLEYLEAVAEAVHRETGLLPHLNPGTMDRETIRRLRNVSVSMGLMLETGSERLSEPGMPHHGSPDKSPAARMHTLALLGQEKTPTTTGLLIGIGETRQETIDALYAIRSLHESYGHIQEVIVQNFRAKPGTKMADAPEPTLERHLWAIAVARLILPIDIRLQAPPNLRPDALHRLLAAGVDDWGGVSPVTPDYVNPEAPWPHLETLAHLTSQAGHRLVERLAVGQQFLQQSDIWISQNMRRAVLQKTDSQGLARTDSWCAGKTASPPIIHDFAPNATVLPETRAALQNIIDGRELDRATISTLFIGGLAELRAITRAADDLRRRIIGDDVTFVVNRNINYTNICAYKCGFCAFSKAATKSARGPAYRLDLEEIARRAAEAADAGATEICLQGGIHPDYTGETYLSILHAVCEAAPDIHIHAFSPLEVLHGAQTLKLPLRKYLSMLKAAGLASLPGTAAEILNDSVRAVICPDKLSSEEWIDVMRAAHGTGLRSTATIMFGHVDNIDHWVEHLLLIRDLQIETGGFTEFVPLPFVHMQSPIWLKGIARPGPTWREALLMHAVSRLVLHPHISNIQASWVKLSPNGCESALQAGCNDLGGVLMNESITRSAGGENGQSFGKAEMEKLCAMIDRPLRQRTTLYGAPRLSTSNGRKCAPEQAQLSGMDI